MDERIPPPKMVIPDPTVETVGQIPITGLSIPLSGIEGEIATSKEHQKSLVAQGQRKVNIIWEVVQAMIAIGVVYVTLFTAAYVVSRGLTTPTVSDSILALGATAFLLLSNLSSLVIGFYFGRTNHQRIGGVGSVEMMGR